MFRVYDRLNMNIKSEEFDEYSQITCGKLKCVQESLSIYSLVVFELNTHLDLNEADYRLRPGYSKVT